MHRSRACGVLQMETSPSRLGDVGRYPAIRSAMVEMWCHPPLCRILRWTAMQGSRLGTAVEVPPSMRESLVALGIDLSMWS